MKVWKDSEDAWTEIRPGIKNRTLSQDEFCTFSLVRFRPNAVFPLHKAIDKHFGLFLKGQGVFDIGRAKIEVGEGDAFYIEPGEDHGFENTSDQEAVVLEVFFAKKEHLDKSQKPTIQ